MACGESRCADRRRHNDVLALEPEALEMADSQGVEGRWAGYRPVRASPRHDSACYATADGTGGGTVR